jgi:hypothetical protein
MNEGTDKGWLARVSEILNAPLPGTGDSGTPPSQEARIPSEADDDDTLLERITDILSRPLPGTEPEPSATPVDDAKTVPSLNQGDEAVKKAQEERDADPVSATGAAAADWMQREYELFNQHQEQARRAFYARQSQEQARFQQFQQAQLESFTGTQEREKAVFRRHQEQRSQSWKNDLHRQFGQQPPPSGWGPGPGRPGMMPPPPPPWWRGPR